MEHLTVWPPENEQEATNKTCTPSPKGTDDRIKATPNPDNEAIHCRDRKRLKLTHCVAESFCNVSLAKWWRTEGRVLIGSSLTGKWVSSNPNTLLKRVARLPEAQSFLKSEIQRLNHLIKQGKDSASTHASLATFLEKMGRFDTALDQINEALKMDDSVKEYHWLHHKYKLRLRIQSEQERLLEDFSTLPPRSTKALKESLPVERRSVKSLSLAEFFTQYSMTSTPVVLTDAVHSMTSVSWTLQHVSEVAGACPVTVKKLIPGSVEWAQLEDSHTTRVSEYIDGLQQQETRPPEQKTYLFDWSLPLYCPQLAKEITIPKYFAGDFLQRTAPGSLYKESWPSLFIAPGGLRSELHVDAFGSNFWMALFQGRKRWVFFKKEELSMLYPVYDSDQSTDPVFEVDLREPDYEKYPLLSLATPIECLLEPGELLFVPAGCPHYVENLEPSLAISSNYVDQSNLSLVKGELEVNGLLDDRAADLLGQFRSADFDTKMNYNNGNMSWEEFKKWPKQCRGTDS